MLKSKYLVFLFVVVFVTGCKTSPTADEGQVVNTIPISASETTQTDTAVASTADTNDQTGDIAPYTVQPGEFNLYPRETNGWDESGWSIITPSDDSRLIYVSSSTGDDETAEFYAPRDIDLVEAPGAIKPYKTIEAAIENAREGYPDWVLLRRGDEWKVYEPIYARSGRSPSERFVVTSYGERNQRPAIKSDASETIRIWSGRSYVAIVGLELDAYRRDPSSPDFPGWGAADESIGLRVFSPEDSTMGTIIIENNDIKFFSKGISINGQGDKLDIVIRRNIVRNSYSERDHSQGIYASHASILLEENVFDHNGWYKKQESDGSEESEGQATKFNHNTYFSDTYHTKFINNIFLRSSSIQNKWASNSDKNSTIDSINSHDLLMEGNLYVGGEVGISAGGNTDYNTGPRWRNVTIKNNVLLAIGRDQPTNRTLGWYMEVSDWQGGSICGNYMLNNDNALVTNLYGINLIGHSSDVSISENTIHGLLRDVPSDKTGAISLDSETKNNITIENNNIQLSDSQMRVVIAHNNTDVTYNGNRYYSDADPDLWFSIDGSDENFDSWQASTGDINSTADRDQFSEPPRSFETYLSLIGASGSIDTFVDLVANQSKQDWSRDLTAQAIAEYIREGYGGLECSQ